MAKGLAAQFAGGFVAAHHGHLHIHQHGVERASLIVRTGDGGHSLLAVNGLFNLHAPTFENRHTDDHVHGVVLHHQHARACEVSGSADRCHGLRRAGARQVQFHPEVGACAQLALHAHIAAHQLSQLAADRQPQTRAAVAPGGGFVALCKGAKDAGLGGGVQARPGVTHFKAQMAVGRTLGKQRHAALFGELQRVGEVVGQDLTHAQSVAQDMALR